MDIPLRRYWDLLADHIRPQRWRFILMAVLMLANIGLQIYNPRVMRNFIDAATAAAPLSDLMVVALTFMGLAVGQSLVGIGASYTGANVAWTATNTLRAELARHCLRLDMGFHNDSSPGELIERIDGDVQQLASFFSQFVIQILGSFLLLIGILIAIFGEDWRLGLVFALFVICSMFALNMVRGVAIGYHRRRREMFADLFGFIEERLAGTEDVRSSGAVQYVLIGLSKRMHAIQQIWLKASLKQRWVQFVGGMSLAVGLTIAVVGGYTLYQQGVFTVGTAFMLVTYMNQMRRPIRILTVQLENLQNIGASTARLFELRAIEPKITDGDVDTLPTGPLSLAFDHVTFGYDEEIVINDLSFEREPGTVLGLLGRTGSGKTTIARLICRLYDVTAGAIRLEGIDLRDLHLQALRNGVAYVTQDVQLFQATVRENLTFFDPEIKDEQVINALEQLEMGDWFHELSNGLDTELEAAGRGLSAGEAQLLAFTRVFLRDPGLVILDEASSRLDPLTEQRLERAVERLLQHRTAVIIAHRLGTVERADDIMILSDGEVVEYGDRERLAADTESQFYHLLETGLEEVLA